MLTEQDPRHPQKKVTYHGDGLSMQASVDTGIADLLLALWRLGMRTEFSCQNFGLRRRQLVTLQNGLTENDTHYGYIAFTHFDDAVRFVRESRQAFCAGDVGLLALETAGERAFVDFPAYKLVAITAYWCNVSRETSNPSYARPSTTWTAAEVEPWHGKATGGQ